jgi:hypothetical protein
MRKTNNLKISAGLAIALIIGSLLYWRKLAFGFALVLGCTLRFQFKKIPWLWCQAMHESGFLNNKWAKEYNNVFGMGRSHTRPRWQLGYVDHPNPNNLQEPAQMAVYSNYFQAVWDRLLWDSYNGIGQNYSSMAAYLQAVKNRGYATDPNYVQSIVNNCRITSTDKTMYLVGAAIALVGTVSLSVMKAMSKTTARQKWYVKLIPWWPLIVAGLFAWQSFSKFMWPQGLNLKRLKG